MQKNAENTKPKIFRHFDNEIEYFKLEFTFIKQTLRIKSTKALRNIIEMSYSILFAQESPIYFEIIKV